eukprot:1314912-Rhodomonas_salina.3
MTHTSVILHQHRRDPSLLTNSNRISHDGHGPACSVLAVSHVTSRGWAPGPWVGVSVRPGSAYPSSRTLLPSGFPPPGSLPPATFLSPNQ